MLLLHVLILSGRGALTVSIASSFMLPRWHGGGRSWHNQVFTNIREDSNGRPSIEADMLPPGAMRVIEWGPLLSSFQSAEYFFHINLPASTHAAVNNERMAIDK
jgi:hypothetical protein